MAFLRSLVAMFLYRFFPFKVLKSAVFSKLDCKLSLVSCFKFHRNSDLPAADYLVFPIHKPGHWIIVIGDIQHKEVLLIDPLSSGVEEIPPEK